MSENNIEKLIASMCLKDEKTSFLRTIKRGSKCLKIMGENTKKKKIDC